MKSGHFGEAHNGLWLPAQPLLPDEDAAHNCQKGYADHQPESVRYGVRVAFPNYLCNLWVKLFNSIEAFAYFLNNFVRFLTAAESLFQFVPQGLLYDSRA